MSARADVLVQVPQLAAAIQREGIAAQGDSRFVLFDVRWRLGESPGAGAQRYAAGHLPSARFLDLERVLTRHTGDPRDGRHPLPDPAALVAALGELGVGSRSQIVVYDEAGSFAAARAWWVLRWAGLRVRVLDGGVDAWTAAGLPLTTEPAAPIRPVDPAPAGSSAATLPTVDIDGAAESARDGLLVDVRAAERFRGEVEPLDPVAGHIPGAVNLPVAQLFAVDGTLPPEPELRAILAPVLAVVAEGRPVAVSCGSGVSAAHAVLALATLGVTVALYPGSWSAWCNTPGRAVAIGAS
jgi:thiosulfate/3-mercaptopyruvate sulfurtransferase